MTKADYPWAVYVVRNGRGVGVSKHDLEEVFRARFRLAPGLMHGAA